MSDIIEQIKTQPFGPVLQREVIEEIERLRREIHQLHKICTLKDEEIERLREKAQLLQQLCALKDAEIERLEFAIVTLEAY